MTMTVQDVSTAYGELEPNIRDAERLAKVIRELFMARIAEIELNMSADEHDYMMETLLDRLRDLMGNIKRGFYKAGKTGLAGRDK